jgi:hypothetical protein
MIMGEISSTGNEFSVPCVYFSQPGKENTQRTLEIAQKRAEELGIRTILIATTSGKTGLQVVELFGNRDVVAVTHSTGFVKPDFQQIDPQIRESILKAGGKVLTCQHALGGVNRAVRRKLKTFELDEIIAFTLRLFGQGVKVAVEIALMASDAGLVSTQEPCLSIGGTNLGADTAVLLKPAHAQDFFDLRIMEILCKPHVT